MHVLVTGGMGFVGYAVAAVLAEAGHHVAVLTHTNRTSPRPEGAEVIHADLRNAAELQRALDGHVFDGVCHLAALTQVRESFKDPLSYFDVNVGGTVNLVRAITEASEAPPAIVVGSTAAIYGSNAAGHLTEDSTPNPDNPYATSKYAAEMLLKWYAHTGAIGATSLRCFAISGAYEGVGDSDETRIIPKALRVAAGLAKGVVINGDGTARREFTHVVDVANAYELALSKTRPGDYEVFNVGSGKAVTINDIIATVEAHTGRSVPVEYRAARPEAHTLVADTTRIREHLGWSACRSSISNIIQDAWSAVSSVQDTQ